MLLFSIFNSVISLQFEFHPTCEMTCTVRQSMSSPRLFVRFNGKLENVTNQHNTSEDNREKVGNRETSNLTDSLHSILFVMYI